jgi:hypothetical protein
MPKPIASIDDATTEWLTSALTPHLPDNSKVVSSGHERIGEDLGIASALYRLTGNYEPTQAGPKTLILKLNLQQGGIHDMLSDRNVKVREALFYEQFADQVPVRIARSYFVSHDSKDNLLTLLLEDFEPARIYGEDAHMSLEDARLVFETIARHHAHFWNSPEIRQADFAPVNDSTDRQADADRIEDGLKTIKTMVPQATYMHDCIERLLKIVPKLPEQIEIPEPYSLLHGDFHRNNLAFKDDDVLLFDWQLTEYGSPASDLATFIITSLSMDSIKKDLPELLDHYWQHLKLSGIDDYSRKSLDRDLGLGITLFVGRIAVLMSAVKDEIASPLATPEFLEQFDEIISHFNARRTLQIFPVILLVLRLRVWWQRTFK